MDDTPARTRSDYVEGERVFGPPSGSFDADWVASAACAADPALAHDRALALAGQAWALLRSGTGPADLAGALPSDAGAVAAVTGEYCALYGL